MLIYIATIFAIIAAALLLYSQKKYTNVAFISSSHGTGKTQFIMSLLNRKVYSFPTNSPTAYTIGKYRILDLPTNSLPHNVEESYFFYKEGDIIPKSFKGFVVVDDIRNLRHSEFKNIISKKGLSQLLQN